MHWSNRQVRTNSLDQNRYMHQADNAVVNIPVELSLGLKKSIGHNFSTKVRTYIRHVDRGNFWIQGYTSCQKHHWLYTKSFIQLVQLLIYCDIEEIHFIVVMSIGIIMLVARFSHINIPAIYIRLVRFMVYTEKISYKYCHPTLLATCWATATSEIENFLDRG